MNSPDKCTAIDPLLTGFISYLDTVQPHRVQGKVPSKCDLKRRVQSLQTDKSVLVQTVQTASHNDLKPLTSYEAPQSRHHYRLDQTYGGTVEMC